MLDVIPAKTLVELKDGPSPLIGLLDEVKPHDVVDAEVFRHLEKRLVHEAEVGRAVYPFGQRAQYREVPVLLFELLALLGPRYGDGYLVAYGRQELDLAPGEPFLFIPCEPYHPDRLAVEVYRKAEDSVKAGSLAGGAYFARFLYVLYVEHLPGFEHFARDASPQGDDGGVLDVIFGEIALGLQDGVLAGIVEEIDSRHVHLVEMDDEVERRVVYILQIRRLVNGLDYLDQHPKAVRYAPGQLERLFYLHPAPYYSV